MCRKLAVLFATSALVASPVAAQDGHEAHQATIDELRAQVAALTAQLEAVNARLDEVEDSQAETAAIAAQTPVASPAPAVPVVTASVPTEISMGAAPEIETADGFSFRPFGRLMMDAGWTSLPDGVGLSDGFDAEARRARLGVNGDIPGGFGYKMEFEFSNGEVEIMDAVATYDAGEVEITVGQHNNFQGLEELSSSLFISFIERSAFTDAFNFRRRLGVSAEYAPGDLLFQFGVFSDNFEVLPGSDRWSVDGRAVYSPQLGDTQLHFGGSLHYADLGDDETIRYRQRPWVHFTSERLVNTGNVPAESEFGIGGEFAVIHGPFHFASEVYVQEVGSIPGMEDLSFLGAYAEAGIFLTEGDSRGYRGGRFNRTRPANPVGEGGIGAIQLNARYDHLDLNSGPVMGGTQDAVQASLIWTTTDHTRFQINFGHLEYSDGPIVTLSGDDDFDADVLAVRAEFDF